MTTNGRTGAKMWRWKIDSWATRITVLAVVLVLWGTTWYFLIHNDILKNYTERGQFGDMFGVVNALFSGLAFAGIIYTIMLQRIELKAQRKELRQTREEFQIQNETLKKQRFENTFFKLFDAHTSLVNSFSVDHSRSGLPLVASIKRELDKGIYQEPSPDTGRRVLIAFHQRLQRVLSDNPKTPETHHSEYNTLLTKFPELRIYFKTITTLLNYVDTTELINEHEKKMYIDIYKSQFMFIENDILIYYIYFATHGRDVDQLKWLLLKYKIVDFSPFSTFHQSHEQKLQEIRLAHFQSHGV